MSKSTAMSRDLCEIFNENEICFIKNISKKHSASIPETTAFRIDAIPDSDFKNLKKIVTLQKIYFLCACLPKSNKWKNLNSRLLIKYLGNNYNKILELLVKHNIIEIDNSYSTGNYSKRYRLLGHSDDIVFKAIFKREFVNFFLITKLESLANGLKNPIIVKELKTYSKVTFPDINEVKNKGLAMIGKPYKNDIFTEDKLKLAIHKFKKAKDLFIPYETPEAAGKRIYTPFIYMNKWVRNLILIDDEELCELDFTCLHPNILINIFSDSDKLKWMTHERIAKHLGITKSEVKRQHLSFFNDEIHKMKTYKIFDFYNQIDPNFLKKLMFDKCIETYKNTSFLTLTKEVELMISIYNKLPEHIFCLYIYDAILVKKSDVEFVQSIMNETAKEMNLFTKVKVSHLS